MAGSFIVNNGTTTLRLDYTATTAKIQAVSSDAVHILWDRGRGDHGTDDEPIVWGDLSNQDKVDILYDYIKDTIMGLGKEYTVKTDKDAATTQALLDHASEHDLG